MRDLADSALRLGPECTDQQWEALDKAFQQILITSELLVTLAIALAGKPSKQ
ncbi:MAG TPA: hypothetical protein VEU73_13845 [Gemmatimonadales bacterium]|nr:hypothetical protein [Gemmatimonadales bacterium]